MSMQHHAFSFLDHYENMLMLGNGHIPAFLLCGSSPVLFDPGVSAFGPLYKKKICEHVVLPENLLLALTHSHFDHCGAAPFLRRQFPGLTVAASRRAAEVLKRPNAVALIGRLNAEYEQELGAELLNTDVRFSALHIDHPLQAGDRLKLQDGTLCEAHETPGHTRDCLSFFFPHTGMLVTGEAAGVYEDGFIHSPFLTSFTDYLSSMKKLEALQPAVLCIAHNGILAGADVPRFLSASRRAAEAYKDMIEHYLALYSGDRHKAVQRITAEEYDARPRHIQKRTPFILNLEAKVNAIIKMHEEEVKDSRAKGNR